MYEQCGQMAVSDMRQLVGMAAAQTQRQEQEQRAAKQDWERQIRKAGMTRSRQEMEDLHRAMQENKIQMQQHLAAMAGNFFGGPKNGGPTETEF